MKRICLSLNEAIEQAKQLPNAFIRRDSSVILGKTPPDISLDTLQEARFFHATKEIRIFKHNGTYVAALVEQEPQDICIMKTYRVIHPRFGYSVTLSYDLEADEDGQTNVVALRFSDWKGEEKA